MDENGARSADGLMDFRTLLVRASDLRVGDVIRVPAWFGSAFAKVEAIDVKERSVGFWWRRRRVRSYSVTGRVAHGETTTLHAVDQIEIADRGLMVLRLDTLDPLHLDRITKARKQ